jgi:hypothetical protein
MKKLLLAVILLIGTNVYANIVSERENWMAAFANQPKLASAALKVMTLNDWGMCGTLSAAVGATEALGTQFDESTAANWGLLGAILTTYVQSNKSKISETSWSAASKPYHKEFMASMDGAYTKYAPRCLELLNRWIAATK